MDVSSLPNGQTTKLTNAALSQATNLKHKAETSTDINKEYKLGKYGTYDSSTNLITWTITVNDAQADINGFELTDSFFSSLTVSDLRISPASGYSITTDTDGKISKIVFSEVSDGTNTNKYTITYQTIPNETTNIFQSSRVTNTATLTGGDTSKNASYGVDIPAKGSVSNSIDSVSVSSNDGARTAEITWNVKIDVPAGYSGTLDITDRILNNWNENYSLHYMTAEQIKEWSEQLFYVTYSDGTVREDISGYWPTADTITFYFEDIETRIEYDIRTIEQGYAYAFKNTKFKISRIQIDVSKLPSYSHHQQVTEIEMIYKTTAVLTGTDSDLYRNEITVNQTVKKEDGYRQSYIKKSDGNGQNTGGSNYVVNEDGSISWKVEVFLGQGENTSQITVTDTFPEGLVLETVRVGDRDGINSNVIYTYEDGKFNRTKNPYNMDGTYFSFQVKYDTNSRTVTTIIRKPDGANLHEK